MRHKSRVRELSIRPMRGPAMAARKGDPRDGRRGVFGPDGRECDLVEPLFDGPGFG
jgi:hypothetical protein